MDKDQKSGQPQVLPDGPEEGLGVLFEPQNRWIRMHRGCFGARVAALQRNSIAQWVKSRANHPRRLKKWGEKIKKIYGYKI